MPVVSALVMLFSYLPFTQDSGWRRNPMLTQDEVNQLRQVIREGNKPLKEGLERVEKKLDRSIEDNAAFHHHTGTFFDEMKNKIEKRIEALEEVLLIPKN
ncbi:MAG: hypothetical protein M3Z24_11215 [Chloroflexota bacterium]|nr:hypothetical protein [Chloroflexota bacterium]